jgi:hypothetical protein
MASFAHESSLAAELSVDMSLPEASSLAHMFASPPPLEREMDALYEEDYDYDYDEDEEAPRQKEQDERKQTDGSSQLSVALSPSNSSSKSLINSKSRSASFIAESPAAAAAAASAPATEQSATVPAAISGPPAPTGSGPPAVSAASTTTPTVNIPPSRCVSHFFVMQVFVLLMGFITSINTARRSQILVGGLNHGDQCLNERGVDGGLTPHCAGLYTHVDFVDFSFQLAASGYALIALPAVGRVSDRQGRKHWLVLSALVLLFPPLNLLCITLPDSIISLDIKHYFVYGFFACRTFAVTFDLTSLVTAELPFYMQPGDERVKIFSRIAAITLMTACIGPIVGSFLPDMICTIVACSLAILATIWASVNMPHIRSPKPAPTVFTGKPPSLCSDNGPLAPFLSIRVLWSSWSLARAGFIVFSFRFLVYGFMEVSILSMRYRFGKDAATLYIGIVNAFFSFVASILVEAIVPKLYMRRYNHKQIIYIGLSCYAFVCMVPVFILKSPWFLLPVLVFIAASIMVFPAISLYLSTSVPPQDHGKVFGAIGSIRLIGQACGPFVLTTVLQVCTNSGDSISYQNVFTKAYWSSFAWSPFAMALIICLFGIWVTSGLIIKPPTPEQIAAFKAMMAAKAAAATGGKPPAAGTPSTNTEDKPKEQLKVPLLEADQLSSSEKSVSKK